MIGLAPKISRKTIKRFSLIYIFRLSCFVIFDRLTTPKTLIIDLSILGQRLTTRFDLGINSFFNYFVLAVKVVIIFV